MSILAMVIIIYYFGVRLNEMQRTRGWQNAVTSYGYIAQDAVPKFVCSACGRPFKI